MTTFRVHEVNEETREFFVNGEYVGAVDHDRFGWEGMQAAEDLFEAVAEKLGAEVEYTTGSLEDDFED